MCPYFISSYALALTRWTMLFLMRIRIDSTLCLVQNSQYFSSLSFSCIHVYWSLHCSLHSFLEIRIGRKKCINPTQFVYSYYHGTQHMQLRMRCRLSRFIVTLTTKKIMQGMRNYMVRVCMSEDNMRLTTIEGIWLATQRNMLKERVWQCND